jgi:RHS repeat-associated protein
MCAGTPLDSLSDWQTYDGDGRLVSWEQYHQLPNQDQDFHYDRGANLRIGGVGTVDPTTERLLAAGGWSYAYDRAGNLVTATGPGGTWSYGWDALERLVSARFNGTLVARYAYDVEGRRVAKRVYTAATGGTVGYGRFVYRGAHVASDLDSLGTVQARYVWGLGTDELVAVWQGGQHHYVALDGVGSVRTVARRDGTFVARWRYRAYGALSDSAGPGLALRYRWAGREWDGELGWYYVRARYYAPAVGRFVSEDPLGAAGGMNVYAYTDGRPLTARDPSGLVREYADRFSGMCLGFGGTACVGFDGSINQMGPSGWYAGAVGGAGFWAFFAKADWRNNYEDYKENYERYAKEHSSSNEETVRTLFRGAKPLGRSEYDAIGDGLITALTPFGGEMTAAAASAMSLILWIRDLGHMWKNNVLNGTGEHAKTWKIGNDPVIVVGGDLFKKSLLHIGWTMLHELGHILDPGDGCRASAFATMMTPSGYSAQTMDCLTAPNSPSWAHD